MKLIVGLGNPGSEYAKTRHNVGFMLIDALAEHLNVNLWKDKFNAQIAETRIGTEKILLVKPQTYMNNSGEAVGLLMRWYKLKPEDIIVAHDDMDISAGAIRIRKKGSSGGHNGIKSLISHVGSENFARVRLGIGRPLPGWTVVNHVLAPFPAKDKVEVDKAIKYLIPAIECIIKESLDIAMNKYNPKKAKKVKNKKVENPQSEEKLNG